MLWGKKETIVDPEKINALLERSVTEVIHKEDLKKSLLSGKQLRVKLGIDPTSPSIHLGRAVQLLKLRDFQQLGHKIVLIIGDFTGVIGDTSDKESERPMLSSETVKENMKNYFAQAGKLLDMSKVEKCYNSSWLGKLGYGEIGEHADQFSLSDFIARENIAKRLKEGTRVSLREVLYPLMQGYDSVAVKADVEIGGTDQKFNLLAGRRLQEHFKQKPQNIIVHELILGLDGRKMSSSWGNTVTLTDEPFNMFGKIMSLPDSLIESYFIHCTRVSVEEVAKIRESLKSDVNPRDIKLRLAREIITIYHGAEKSKKAEENFIKTFSQGGVPEDVLVAEALKGKLLVEILLEKNLVDSKTEWRRLVWEHAVSDAESGEEITDPNFAVSKAQIFRIGKKRFIEVRLK